MDRYGCSTHIYYEGYRPCPDCYPSPEDGFYLAMTENGLELVQLDGGDVIVPGSAARFHWAGYAAEWRGPLDLAAIWSQLHSCGGSQT